jgi:hypothetical protein
VLVNSGARGTDFPPKQPDHAIFGLQTAHFRAEWDAQKSVNYVSAAGINYARPFAAAQAHAAENY